MRLLFLGDVMGRAGRAAVTARLPELRAAWRLDFVVVNGENASGGMGLTQPMPRTCSRPGRTASRSATTPSTTGR
jgi:2',3'-cyclic-nucleotide 2'-phosphodiesterase